MSYTPVGSISDVAALYGEVIARGHVFLDGNKRTAMTSMLAFLEINGFRLENLGSNITLADKMVEVAEGHLPRDMFAMWLRSRIKSA